MALRTLPLKWKTWRRLSRFVLDCNVNHSPCENVQKVKKNGGKVVKELWEENDEHGVVRMATVQTVSNASRLVLMFSTRFSVW